MVISKEGIHTTYPSNTTTEYTTQGTTGYQLKNQTDKDKPKNLAHSENNALDETKTTGVLIFVLFTIITVLALTIYLAVLKKQNGAYEITKRQDIESHDDLTYESFAILCITYVSPLPMRIIEV